MKSRYLTEKEFYQILPNIPPEHRLIFETAYLTGLRIGDVLKIRKSDIKCTESGHFITFIAEKTQKRGIAPISADLYKKLHNKTAGRRNFLFPSERSRSGHITRQYAWQIFKKGARSAGVVVSGVSPHALRKSFAADTLHASDFATVQKLLQHSNPAITSDYAFSDILSGKRPDAPITWGEVGALVSMVAAQLGEQKKSSGKV